MHDRIIAAITEKGSLCSADLDIPKKVGWYWSETKLFRAALEHMYFTGELAVHHKSGAIKYYDGQRVILTNGELAEALPSLPEYDRVSNPQDFAAPAKGNGGTFTWGIRILSLMKRLSGRPAASRKPWTRFYDITASARIATIENGHIDRDAEESIKSRLVAALFKFRFDEQEV